MRLVAIVARTLLLLISLVVTLVLIVSQGHRPGDVPSAFVGLGVTVAALGVIVWIMQTHGGRRISVFGSRPGNEGLKRYVNSRRAVIEMVAGGIVVALFGLLAGMLFPSL